MITRLLSICCPLVFITLAGCFDGSSLNIGSGSKSDMNTQVAMVNGALQLTPPKGYCFDGTPRRGGSHVVIASCQILSGGKSGHVVPPAILTVTIGNMDPEFTVPSPQEIAVIADAQLLFSRRHAGTSYTHLGSGGDVRLNTTDSKHWRAYGHVGNYPVLLTLYAPENGALAERGGTALLVETRAGLRATP